MWGHAVPSRLWMRPSGAVSFTSVTFAMVFGPCPFPTSPFISPLNGAVRPQCGGGVGKGARALAWAFIAGARSWRLMNGSGPRGDMWCQSKGAELGLHWARGGWHGFATV
jgi:hypothetical protein